MNTKDNQEKAVEFPIGAQIAKIGIRTEKKGRLTITTKNGEVVQIGRRSPSSQHQVTEII